MTTDSIVHLTGGEANNYSARLHRFEEIRELLGHDVVLIPVPAGSKAPVESKWQNRRLIDMADDAYRAKLAAAGNLGVLMGSPSGGLCSIDIDNDEELNEFLIQNPKLQSTLRTRGLRGGNIWIRIDGNFPKLTRLEWRDGKAWGEFRSDGGQTIICGRHPSGCQYTITHRTQPVKMQFDEIVWPEGLNIPWRRKTQWPQNIILPSGEVTISEAAQVIFNQLAESRTMFYRGGALVEIELDDGIASLSVVTPESFRSRVERLGRVVAWRVGPGGLPVLKPCKMPRDDANALMETLEARELLPPIANVLRCPVLIEMPTGDVTVLCRGYHPEQGGLLIQADEEPPRVELSQAVQDIEWLLDEFEFQTPGDRSRAIGAVITPALRMGGHVTGHIPIDVAEANESQAGKGYRHDLVRAIYNEIAYTITARKGGVGGTDESFAHALVAGRPFIVLDNLRGNLDSQNLESFLTCSGKFPARVPYKGEVQVNPKRFLLQLSSNGMSSTRDLANRASICRIRKRPGFIYRDALGEVRKRQLHFLGCVLAIVTEWIAQGKPRTGDVRHSFRDWAQPLDWIVQHIFKAAPLMDGHPAAQERVSNPALTWLREVALTVERDDKLSVSLVASDIYEICEQYGIEIPGKPHSEDEAKKQIGRLFRRMFGSGSMVEVDGFQITRTIIHETRREGGAMEVKHYIFAKMQAAPNIPNAPNTP